MTTKPGRAVGLVLFRRPTHVRSRLVLGDEHDVQRRLMIALQESLSGLALHGRDENPGVSGLFSDKLR